MIRNRSITPFTSRSRRRPRLVRSRRTRLRSGATVLELAIVMPLFLAVTFGVIDYGWVFFARNTMYQAARESARAMAVQERDAAEGTAIAQDVLDATLSRNDFTINIQNTSNPEIVVAISIPVSDVALSGVTILPSAAMTARVVMLREGL